MNGGMQLVLGRVLINAQMLGFGDEAEICARPEQPQRSSLLPRLVCYRRSADRSGQVILSGHTYLRGGAPCSTGKRREFITRSAAPQERGREPIDCCIATAQRREAAR